ncbi:hypothetical protein OKW43_002494 [Paraburkholderia sp. WC7.3g]
MDGFDLLILGFMLPVIAADLHLSSRSIASNPQHPRRLFR